MDPTSDASVERLLRRQPWDGIADRLPAAEHGSP